jgi:predicted nucleic acid-binding protein
MTAAVVDAWALLAWLQDEEPASSEVDAFLGKAARGKLGLHLSLVNAGEVFYRLAKDRGAHSAAQFREGLAAMPVQIDVPGQAAIWKAAEWKAVAAISYADGFAAELAMRHNATLLTGDRDFAAISGLKVHWLKRSS